MEKSTPTSINTQRTSYVFPATAAAHARIISPDSPEFFSGSSFKPLHLTHQPWVSAYLRSDSDSEKSQKFRLPFAVQYAHFQGGSSNESSYSNCKSIALPPTRQIPILDRRASSPMNLNLNTNDIIIPLASESTLDSESPKSKSQVSSSPESSTSSDIGQSNQGEIDYFSLPLESPQTSESTTDQWTSTDGEYSQDFENRVSLLGTKPQCSERPTSSSPSPLTPSDTTRNQCSESSSSRRKRLGLRRRNSSALPITAFRGTLIGVITTAEDAFGYSPTSSSSDD